MKEEEKQKLYADALEIWGFDTQIDMVTEECSELIKALMMYRRGRNTGTAHILEEIVDVENMLEQLKFMFKFLPGQIEFMQDMKLYGLKDVIEKKRKE